jgi:hypothetical protein
MPATNPRRRRFPVVTLALSVLCVALAIRSIGLRYALSWQQVTPEGNSLIRTSYGVDAERLGLGLFYEQQLAPATNREAVQQFLYDIPPGLNWRSRAASDEPWPPLRRLGYGLEREVNDQPGAFQNALRVRGRCGFYHCCWQFRPSSI